MSNNNVTSRPIVIETDRIKKLKKHFRDNQDLYFVSATGVAAGLLLARGMGWRKIPKVDRADVIYQWMADTVGKGYNIYALTNEQKALWEAAWAWSVKESDRLSVPLTTVLDVLTQEFADDKVHIQLT